MRINISAMSCVGGDYITWSRVRYRLYSKKKKKMSTRISKKEKKLFEAK